MGEKKRRMTADPGVVDLKARAKDKKAMKIGGMRITWKAIGLFMGLMVVLDLIFFAIFQFGFGACYGVLCLI